MFVLINLLEIEKRIKLKITPKIGMAITPIPNKLKNKSLIDSRAPVLVKKERVRITENPRIANPDTDLIVFFSKLRGDTSFGFLPLGMLKNILH